jgi:hypothetical protein
MEDLEGAFMTFHADPGYAQLVRSIFKAIQRLPAGAPAADETEPLARSAFAARPFMVEGERRVAKVVESSTWEAPHARLQPDVSSLTLEQREKLAAAWLADALDEHAAVAAFARFTLQLLSLGAPPELLRAAHRASLDEVAHAELCFGLASAYADRPLSAGPLDTTDAVTRANRETAVLDTIREGCIGETINAMVLLTAADRCADPVVTNVLQRIATDEMRHAGLAWRFVRWALQGHDELRAPVRDAFDEAIASVTAPSSGRSEPSWMARYGRVTPSERAKIAAECTHSVIAPCAEALLEQGPRSFPGATRLRQLTEWS